MDKLATFRIQNEDWLAFQALCKEGGSNASQVEEPIFRRVRTPRGFGSHRPRALRRAGPWCFWPECRWVARFGLRPLSFSPRSSSEWDPGDHAGVGSGDPNNTVLERSRGESGREWLTPRQVVAAAELSGPAYLACVHAKVARLAESARSAPQGSDSSMGRPEPSLPRRSPDGLSGPFATVQSSRRGTGRASVQGSMRLETHFRSLGV